MREWKRGTPLDSSNAVKVFEGEVADVAVSGYVVVISELCNVGTIFSIEVFYFCFSLAIATSATSSDAGPLPSIPAKVSSHCHQVNK